jgi:hypothetical protein
MTALGHAIYPYMQQIAQTADHALQAVQAFRVDAAIERATWSAAVTR